MRQSAGWLATAYIEAARAESTRTAYGFYWRQWERWCAVQGITALPATPGALLSYVVARADAGDRVSTIRVRLAALSSVHGEHGHESPTHTHDARQLLRGIAKMQAGETPAQVSGLTALCMERIEDSIDLRKSIQRENLALCWVMRDALLRRSEAAALRWADVERDRDGSGRLLIRRSKTDQLGIGHVAYLSKSAMRALGRMRPAEATETDLVFPFHPRTIERRIRATARRAGLPGRFRGHSPRIGMTLDLAERGTSLVELQQVGRWKSPSMPAHYIRRQEAARGAVARFYQKGSKA